MNTDTIQLQSYLIGPKTKKLILEWSSGGVANAVTSSILNPMDVSKTRIQATKKASYHSKTVNPTLSRTLIQLYKEGGIVGLWRPGLSASISREMLYSGPRAGFYVPVRDQINKLLGNRDKNNSIECKILAALTTGSIGAAIANPADVIKIRMMANTTGSTTLKKEAFSIFNSVGLRGFYKGLLPSTMRGALVTVGGLATYDHSKALLKKYLDLHEGFYLHASSSLITGLVSTTIAAPLDVIKTRSMVASSTVNSGSKVKFLSIISSTLREEGIRVVVRGWLPAYLRLGPHALICYPIFENIRRFSGLSYI